MGDLNGAEEDGGGGGDEGGVLGSLERNLSRAKDIRWKMLRIRLAQKKRPPHRKCLRLLLLGGKHTSLVGSLRLTNPQGKPVAKVSIAIAESD
eukprot:9477894-Pyramimonas_sp.AAC.1